MKNKKYFVGIIVFVVGFFVLNFSSINKTQINIAHAAAGEGIWTQITPPGIDIDCHCDPYVAGQDRFGVFAMTADPTRPGTAYFGGDHQGIWKTTNFGDTWVKINTGTGGNLIDGSAWSMAVSPDGSYMLSVNGYGTSLGVFKSTDGGISWTQKLSTDTTALAIAPDDSTHALVTPHGSTGDTRWFESTDNGNTWNSIGSVTAGIGYVGAFIDTNTYVGIGPNGVWRGAKSAGTWTWSQVLPNLSGPHGGAELYRDAANGFFYVGGYDSTNNNRGQVFRTTLADRGQNWTKVSDLYPFTFGVSTIWGTPNNLYAMGNYATHASYGPYYQTAPLPVGVWATGSTPAAMTNGAHSAVAMYNGTNYVILTANSNNGIWRYIEPAGSGNPTPTPTPTPTPNPPPTPIVGDINLDHIVNAIDFSILNSHWFTNYAPADLNNDGLVNAIDFSMLNANWFRTW
jgi:hypothetical protein